MKTFEILSLIVFVGMVSSINTFAQIQTNLNPISTEVSTTHDYVKAVVNKIEGRLHASSIHSGDYELARSQFRVTTSTVLTQFESEVYANVFSPLGSYTEDYNAIFNNRNILPEEKEPLLQAKRNELNIVIALYEQEYQRQLTKLYDVVPPLYVSDVQLQFKSYNDRSGRSSGYFENYLFSDGSQLAIMVPQGYYGQVTGRAGNGWDTTLSIVKSSVDFSYFYGFSDKAYQTIAKVCSGSSLHSQVPSQYCITSSIADLTEYFISVGRSLNRNIEVTLADGTILTLKKLPLQRENLTLLSLSRIVLPADFINLPFTN